jgi:pseudaminic acid cytidylyltransferase
MKIAVIPARGGSKRIPRKNIKEFCGKPMIAWSIAAAKTSGLFDRIIVSTDDTEIAEVSRAHGAEVPFMRPAELADDYTGTPKVIAHAIDWLREQGHQPSEVCCIYATAPFIQVEDLKQGLVKLESGAWQYVFSATTFGFPIFRSFEQMAGGGLKMFFPEFYSKRSQDLPEASHDAGQFYWASADTWTSGKRIFDELSSIVLLPRWRVQDIDTLEDWERAEKLGRVIYAA